MRRTDGVFRTERTKSFTCRSPQGVGQRHIHPERRRHRPRAVVHLRIGHTRRIVDIVQLRTSEDIDSVAVRHLQTADFLCVGRVVHRDARVHMPAEAEMRESLSKRLLHHGLRRVGAITEGGMRMIICF